MAKVHERIQALEAKFKQPKMQQHPSEQRALDSADRR
jgi:hypothetical protein